MPRPIIGSHASFKSTGVTKVQQRIDCVETVEYSNNVLHSLLELLPLNDIEEDAWDTFLEAEKVNCLTDSLFTLDYSNNYDQHQPYLAEGGDSSQMKQCHFLHIAKLFDQMSHILRNRNAIQDDTFFWNTLKGVTYAHNSCLPNHFTNSQALLLLLVQCVVDGYPLLVESSFQLFLFLCQCSKAVENFFSPNLFITRRVIHLIQRIVIREVDQSGSVTDGTDISSDDENKHPALSSLCHTTFSINDTVNLLNMMSRFLSHIQLSFLRLDLGRHTITVVVDLFTELVLKGHTDDLKQLGYQGILHFMLRLQYLRSSAMKIPLLELEKDSTPFNDHICYDPHDHIQNHLVGPLGQPLIPMNSGTSSIDILLFGITTFIRHLTLTFAGRRSTGHIGSQTTSAGKLLTATRQITIRLLQDLITKIPVLLYCEQLPVVVNKKKEDHHIDEEDISVSEIIHHTKQDCRESITGTTPILSDIEDDGVVSDSEKPNQCVPNRPKKKMKSNKKKEANKMKEQLEYTANDPICALLCRACLLVPDRRDPRDLLTLAILDICRTADEVEKRDRPQVIQFVKDAIKRSDEWYYQHNYLEEHQLSSCFLPLKFRFIRFLIHLLQCNKPSLRILGVDISSALLEHLLKKPLEYDNHCLNRQNPLCIKDRYILETQLYCTLLKEVVARFQDTQPGTRARALECLSLLLSTITSNLDILSSIIIMITELSENDIITPCRILCYCLLSSFLRLPFPIKDSSISYFSLDIHTILREKVTDDRQIVRKSALTLLRTVAFVLTQLHMYCQQTQDIYSPDLSRPPELMKQLDYFGVTSSTMISGLCSDTSLQIRVKAITTLQELLEMVPYNITIRKLWLTYVLPSITDSEKLVIEKSLEFLSSTILHKIATCEITHIIQAAQQIKGCEWPPVYALLQTANYEDLDYIQRGIATLHKRDGSLCKLFVKALEDVIVQLTQLQESKTLSHLLYWPGPLFQIIQEVVSLQPSTSIPSHVIISCWMILSKYIINISIAPEQPLSILDKSLLTSAKCILESMKYQAAQFTEIQRTLLTPSFTTMLQTFEAPLPLISPLLSCLRLMFSKEHQAIEWATTLLHHIEKIIFNSLQQFNGINSTETTPIEHNSLMSRASFKLLYHSLFTLGDLGYFWNVPISTSLITAIHSFSMNTMCPSLQSSNVLSHHTLDTSTHKKLSSISIPDMIRGQACICLGKLCLIKENITKKLIDSIVSQLNEKQPDIVRCNTLVILSDLTVRYTSLTDRYLPQLTSCLSGVSTSSLIRKQSLCLISSLVAQDFIKCKGLVVFRWLGHPMFTASAVGGSIFVKKGSPFCLVQEPRRREAIYAFFLQNMTDRDRHELSRRLVHHFLAAFVDGNDDDITNRRRQLELPRSTEESAGAALRDALRLLGCKQMKITFDRHTKHLSGSKLQHHTITNDDDIVDSQEGGEGITQDIKSEYELNLLKRNLAYQILPTLLSLKRVMEDARSIFLRDILQCLSALLYDYKDELSEMLFHDPILAKQLDFDFKRGVLINSLDLINDSQQFPIDHSSINYPSETHTTRCGNRHSLCRDTSPSITYTGSQTKQTSSHTQSGTIIHSRRRGSLETYTGNKIMTLSLPRLREEAAIILCKTQHDSHSDMTHMIHHPSIESSVPLNDLPLTLDDKGSCVKSHHIDLTTQHYPVNHEIIDLLSSMSHTPREIKSQIVSSETHRLSEELLGRTKKEQLEQEIVLTALRSSRRRHSLPSACGPVFDSTLLNMIGSNTDNVLEQDNQNNNNPMILSHTCEYLNHGITTGVSKKRLRHLMPVISHLEINQELLTTEHIESTMTEDLTQTVSNKDILFNDCAKSTTSVDILHHRGHQHYDPSDTVKKNITTQNKLKPVELMDQTSSHSRIYSKGRQSKVPSIVSKPLKKKTSEVNTTTSPKNNELKTFKTHTTQSDSHLKEDTVSSLRYIPVRRGKHR